MHCPSVDELVALVEGRMEGVSPSLERHLDRCDSCHQVVVAAASAEPDSEPGRDVGERYDVMGEVGRGGQSRVLRVYDRELVREVALKQFLIRGDPHASQAPSAADRCLREVRVTGALSHPAILPIHDMGVWRTGVPYYTMPLVDGPTLAEVVNDTPSVAARLRLLPHVVQVSQAIGYAHEHGFLHRDLKPDNIMVGSFGQTLLLDWGLARLPEAGTASLRSTQDVEMGVTLDGAVVGTPAYMSPEQAAGHGEDVGPASDVWSLGAVLRFVLCGSAPVGGHSVASTLERVRKCELRPTAAPDGDVPPELAAIVQRAMAAAPADRYAGAMDIANDLIAFQSGDRVSSYSYGFPERVLRFARRYKALLLSLGALVSSLIVVALASFYSYRTEVKARTETSDALQQTQLAWAQADAAAQERRQQARAALFDLSAAHIDTAERDRADGRLLSSRLFAASALRNNPSFPGSPFYESATADGRASGDNVIARALGQLGLAELDPVQGLAEPIPFPVSEKTTATARGGEFAARADGTRIATILSIRDGAEVVALDGHDGEVVDVALSAAGGFAATQDAGGTVRRWRLPDGVEEARWSEGGVAGATLAVSDRGAVAFMHQTGTIALVGDGGQATHVRDVGNVTAFAFSSDGLWLVAGGNRNRAGEVTIVDAGTGRRFGRVGTGGRGVADIVLSEDAGTIFVAANRHVAVVDRLSLSVQAELPTGSPAILALSPNGRWLAAGMNRSVAILDVRAGIKIAQLFTPVGTVRDLWMTGDRLFARGDKGNDGWVLRRADQGPFPVATGVRWWSDADAPVTYGQFLGNPNVQSVDWAQRSSTEIPLAGAGDVAYIGVDGSHRVTQRYDGTVTTWKVDGGRWEPLQTLTFADPAPSGIAVSVATHRFAVGRTDGTVELFRLMESEPHLVLRGHSDSSTMRLVFSNDGQHLASATLAGEIFTWALDDSAPAPRRLALHAKSPRAVEFGATNDVLFAAGTFGVKRFRRGEAEPEVLLTANHRQLHRRDGLLVMKSFDGEVTVWDTDVDRAVFIARPGRIARAKRALIEPGGEGLRVISHYHAYRLPLRHHASVDAQRLLSDAEQAAGRTTNTTR